VPRLATLPLSPQAPANGVSLMRSLLYSPWTWLVLGIAVGFFMGTMGWIDVEHLGQEAW
jgi:hypothetical protein